MSTCKIILLTMPAAHICMLKALQHVREGSTFAEAAKHINHPSRVTGGGKSAESCNSRGTTVLFASHVEGTTVSALEVREQPGGKGWSKQGPVSQPHPASAANTSKTLPSEKGLRGWMESLHN